jgi:hypothetical protein
MEEHTDDGVASDTRGDARRRARRTNADGGRIHVTTRRRQVAARLERAGAR